MPKKIGLFRTNVPISFSTLQYSTRNPFQCSLLSTNYSHGGSVTSKINKNTKTFPITQATSFHQLRKFATIFVYSMFLQK